MYLRRQRASMLLSLLSLLCLASAASVAAQVSIAAHAPLSGACRVLCNATFLNAALGAGLLVNDSKTLVDRPLLVDPVDLLAAFDALQRTSPSPAAFAAFVDAHFGVEGSDLLPWVPADFNPALPPVLQPQNLRDTRVAELAAQLHARWNLLSRVVADDVGARPERHTLLAHRFPIVVPGGRFRESYYWDTYWIMLGLQTSNMVCAADHCVS
jgi:alpha,alpha-trehalase